MPSMFACGHSREPMAQKALNFASSRLVAYLWSLTEVQELRRQNSHRQGLYSARLAALSSCHSPVIKPRATQKVSSS